MMNQYLIVRDSDGFIYGTQLQDHPDDGPIIPQGGSPIDGATLVKFDGGFTRAGRRDSEAAYWIDGALQWVETSTLGDAIDRALDAIDDAADAARADVLARKPTKAEEYTQAEAQARAWAAAGYAGSAPDDVASWAEAKRREGMTERQAADSIIEQADAYRALLSGIRRLRLVHMENTRHAATPADAHAEVSAFNAALADIMPM